LVAVTPRRRLALQILIPLLIFSAAEFVARGVLDLRSRLALAERRTLAAYQGMPLLGQYLHDLRDCALQTQRAAAKRYARYVLQDINEECSTPTVNYAGRMRRTWNPPADLDSSTATEEIGMFGGSTLEGVGAMDDETIPSQFSRLVAHSGRSPAVHVLNYGASGYTFTQGVFKLVTLLREGHHFDDVIFYGGANDVEYAYETGMPGALDGEDVLETRLEGGPVERVEEFAKTQMNACVLCMAFGMLARHTPFVQDHLTPYLVRLRDAIHFKKGQASELDVAAFASAIASEYAQSHELLVRLSTAYHFRHLEFWQPTLLLDAAYGPGEAPLARMDPRLTDDRLRHVYAATRDVVRSKTMSDFYDVSDALDARSHACYVDAVHLSGTCDGIVASRLYAVWQQSRQ
jgi:hypothetical protein